MWVNLITAMHKVTLNCNQQLTLPFWGWLVVQTYTIITFCLSQSSAGEQWRRRGGLKADPVEMLWLTWMGAILKYESIPYFKGQMATSNTDHRLYSQYLSYVMWLIVYSFLKACWFMCWCMVYAFTLTALISIIIISSVRISSIGTSSTLWQESD